MTDTYELPELPPIPYLPNSKEAEERILGEWAREYALLAVKAERERCIAACVNEQMVEEVGWQDFSYNTAIGNCVAAIRRGTQ